MKAFHSGMSLLSVAVLLSTAPSRAQTPGTIDERPELYQDVIDCSSEANDNMRLACYDKSVLKLERATNKSEIVIADRETVREEKKGLFGLTSPSLKLFGDDEDVDEIQGIVQTARLVNRKWFFSLVDGATWQQIDGRKLSRYPKKGMEVEIRKAALGSFFANFDGQRAIKVKRVQ